MNRFTAASVVAGLIFVIAAAAGADTITVGSPMIHPDTEANREAVEGVLARASVLADRRYSDLFDVEYGRSGGEYHIESVVSFDPGQGPIGTLSISRAGDATEHTFPILGAFGEDKVGYYAAGIATLWNAFTRGFDEGLSQPPRYVDELPVEVVASLLVPANPMLVASLSPIAGAPLSDGSIVVGMSVAAARLDPWLRLIGRPGGDEVDANNFNLAARVFTTPADTILLMPSTGRVYYRVVDGVPGSVRAQIGNDVTTTPLAVLTDGSVVQKNVSTNDVERFEGRKRTRFSLGTGAISYVTLIAAGPDGNLWSWDQVERRIKIFSPEGVLLDSVVAIHRADSWLSPTALVPAPDGGFLLVLQGATGPQIAKFRRDGRPAWVLDEIASDFPESLPYNLQLVVGANGADLYLIDYLGRRVVKLYDLTAASGGADREVERVLELNRAIVDDPDDTGAFAEKARYYASIGATELAQATWQRLLEVDPYDSDAADEVARLELEKLRTLARYQDRSTREILDSLGPESARQQFSTAVRTYEQILSLDPEDTGSAAMKRSLEEIFLERQALPGERRKPLTVVGTEIENLFPSLVSYYRTHSVGTVTIENTLDEPVFEVVARFLVPKYMDLPMEGGRIDRLEPGDRATLDLRVVLRESVLTLEEDLQFPAKVEVVYLAGTGAARSEQSVVAYPAVTIHRKTALSWDDSGKIASFIVPREEIIERFAINVVRGIDLEVPGIPTRMVRAAAVADAVGIYGIDYIEDPDSPFSEIFGKGGVIDTVRFPRDTLQYRIGDCDDTTALLASLLEAVGVRTAIMTSPGHVFMAFDTGEPESNAWLFETDELETIVAKGHVWIPIETTTLTSGFFASWKNASALVRKYPGEVEFLPTADAQSVYPPIPLPPATFAVVEPRAETVSATLERSLESASAALYEGAVALYRSRISGASGSRAARYENQLGALHARFGKLDLAASTLEALVEREPRFSAGYVNLSNVYLLLEEPAKAIELLEEGVKRAGESAILSISLSQALFRVGRGAEAAEWFGRAAEQAPDLAQRYAYLAGGGDSTARAGVEPEAPLMWDGGEE